MDTFTANDIAARAYTTAQAAARGGHCPVEHLRRAVAADPTFAVAVADLAALGAAEPQPSTRPATRWERQHLDIVRAASIGQHARADGLLREQVADGGADPLAEWIVLGGAPCHPRAVLGRL